MSLIKRQSAVWVLIGTLVATVFSFLFQAYLSVTLSDGEFGMISSIMIGAVLLSYFAAAGVQNVMMDIVKVRRNLPKDALVAFRWIWTAYFIASLLIVIIAHVAFGIPLHQSLFLVSLAMMLAMFSILSSASQSQDDFKMVCIHTVGPELVKLLAVIFVVIVGSASIDDIGWIFSGVFIATSMSIFIFGILQDEWRFERGYFKLLIAGFPYVISSVLFMVYYRFTLLALAYVGRSDEAGSLSIIYLFLTASLILPTAYSQRFLLGRWHSIGVEDGTIFAKEILQQLSQMLLFGSMVVVIWVSASGPILKFIYENRYPDAQLYSNWFAMIFLLRALSLPLQTASSIEDLKWGKTLCIAFAAIATLVASFALVPKFGFLGAFVAGLLAEIALIFGLSILVLRHILGKRGK